MSNQDESCEGHKQCSICSKIGDFEYGMQTGGREEEDTFLPNAAGCLKVVRDLNGPGGSVVLLKQCSECHTYYHYRTTYEYLVYGSEDEQYLKRLTDDSSLSYLFGDDSAESRQIEMHGPKPKGFWTGFKSPNFIDQFYYCLQTHWYTITLGFLDCCKRLHPTNETWSFHGCFLSPRDEGLLLIVSFDGENEWCIPLKWTDDQQGSVIDSIGKHISPTSYVKKADFKKLKKPLVLREWVWLSEESGVSLTTLKICADKLLWHIDADHDFKTVSMDDEQSFENFIESGPKRMLPDDVLNEIVLHFGLSNPTWLNHS